MAGLTAAEIEQIERMKRRTPGDPLVAIHEYLPGDGQPTVQGAVNVMRVMFETDRAPQSWVGPLMDRDELWVPSQFNVETFARSGIPEEKMRVLGGTMDFDAFRPGEVEPWDLGAPEGRSPSSRTSTSPSARAGSSCCTAGPAHSARTTTSASS